MPKATNRKKYKLTTCAEWLGTNRGYGRHTRAGEHPCDACREAEKLRARERMENPESRATHNENQKHYMKKRRANLSPEEKARENERIRISTELHHECITNGENPFCVCCGETDKSKLQVDHIDPYLEDRRDPTNIQILCKSCNSSKWQGERCTLEH